MVIHSDERPYKCEECTASFKTKGLLTRHSFKHSNQGRFTCSECDQSFVRKEYWRLHLKRVHGIDNYDQVKKPLQHFNDDGDVVDMKAEYEEYLVEVQLADDSLGDLPRLPGADQVQTMQALDRDEEVAGTIEALCTVSNADAAILYCDS